MTVVSSAARPRAVARAAVEWPTLSLLVGVYGGFAAVTFFHAALPVALVSALGAVLLALHSSLQHELIHGHPTRWRRVNRLLALTPLSLWLPFDSYRISHLMHHRDERLTDPLDDPESYYWTETEWRRLGTLPRLLVRVQSTLLGRMLIGPFWIVGGFLFSEARAVIAGEGPARRIWTAHVLHLVPLLVWLVFVAKMNLLFYVLGIVYPATAILLIRSFAEHRAEHDVVHRTAIVESSWLLGPLFLFNNLHAVHHARPTMPWYRIPSWYRAHRSELVRANGGLVYRGYLDVARRYLLRPHDEPAHPHGRAP